MEDFKKILKYVLIGIATFAVLALVFFGGIRYQKRESSAAEKYLHEQIELAQKEADNWKAQYEEAAKGTETLLLKIDSLENRLRIIKVQYKQKVALIESYTKPELKQFYLDRYEEVKDSTDNIILPTEVTRNAAVELVEKDGLVEENKVLKLEAIEYQNVVILKDSLVVFKENENEQLRKAIELYRLENQGNLENAERLNKELRKQTTLKTVFETTTGVTALGLILALIF